MANAALPLTQACIRKPLARPTVLHTSKLHANNTDAALRGKGMGHRMMGVDGLFAFIHIC